MSQYTIDLYSLNPNTGTFTKYESIDTFVNLSYMNKLNAIGECQFEMDVFDPKLTRSNFIPYRTQIAVKRDDTYIFFGPYYNPDGQFQDLQGTVAIRAYSYLYHLVNRYTNKVVQYQATTDISDIAWDLIQQAQSRAYGALGINRNAPATGVLKPKTFERQRISDKLMEFTQIIGGFDFDFSPVVDANNNIIYVNFNLYYPTAGVLRSDLTPLKLGVNIHDFGFGTTGELFNSGIAEGSGTSDVITSTYDNTSLQSAYTRLETVKKYSEISAKVTLDDILNGYMNRVSSPQYIVRVSLNPSVTPTLDDFFLGDTLNIDINIQDIKPTAGDMIKFVGQGRVMELGVTVDENGAEMVVPTLMFY